MRAIFVGFSHFFFVSLNGNTFAGGDLRTRIRHYVTFKRWRQPRIYAGPSGAQLLKLNALVDQLPNKGEGRTSKGGNETGLTLFW